MQIKTMDGAMHEVSQMELEKAFRAMHPEAFESMEKAVSSMVQECVAYKHKASTNLKRIAECDSHPETQDDVKTCLAKVIKHGSPADIADAMYEAMQFEAARFAHHLMKDYEEK